MARPTTSLISREAIITAALRIVDSDGFRRLSIRRIGRELGVDGSSLYHYFSSKQQLVDAVAAHVLADVDSSVIAADPEDWKAHLVDSCVALRRALADHPNITPAVVERRQWSFALPAIERSAKVMTRSGLPPAEQLLIWESLEALILGSLLLTVSHAATAGERDLRREYPMVYAAISAERASDEQRLVRAVSALLAGFETPSDRPARRRGRTGHRS